MKVILGLKMEKLGLKMEKNGALDMCAMWEVS